MAIEADETISLGIVLQPIPAMLPTHWATALFLPRRLASARFCGCITAKREVTKKWSYFLFADQPTAICGLPSNVWFADQVILQS